MWEDATLPPTGPGTWLQESSSQIVERFLLQSICAGMLARLVYFERSLGGRSARKGCKKRDNGRYWLEKWLCQYNSTLVNLPEKSPILLAIILNMVRKVPISSVIEKSIVALILVCDKRSDSEELSSWSWLLRFKIYSWTSFWSFRLGMLHNGTCVNVENYLFLFFWTEDSLWKHCSNTSVK